MPNENLVDQFTAQVERFVQSPYVNAPEPVAQFVAAVGPRPEERAIDVACGPSITSSTLRTGSRAPSRARTRQAGPAHVSGAMGDPGGDAARGVILDRYHRRGALRWEVAEEYAALVTAW